MIIYTIRPFPGFTIRNIKIRVPATKTITKPKFFICDQAEHFFISNRVHTANYDKTLFMLHQLRNILAEKGEGRVGDHDVCLFEQLDALPGAKVPVALQSGHDVAAVLQQVFHVRQVCRAIGVLIRDLGDFYLVGHAGNRLLRHIGESFRPR